MVPSEIPQPLFLMYTLIIPHLCHLMYPSDVPNLFSKVPIDYIQPLLLMSPLNADVLTNCSECLCKPL